MAIDYGTKRTGIAVTDPLQMIVTGLDTVSTPVLFDFLKQYCADEEVEARVQIDRYRRYSQSAKLSVGDIQRNSGYRPAFLRGEQDETW